ncbi:uncharacterized protein LOC116177484, partial [Photinus pyralis]|uniref:uncharacterized protein LOC116177484 n=1 Tax=Photinus pyralis TaxID=7054 RepID=UPI00126701D1
MQGPSGALRFALLLLIATVGPPGVYTEGNVGCLFSQRLCLEEIEWCFDDYAFGRCLPTTGSVEEEDLYRFDLEREVLHALSRELRRLFALGYRWSHAYTQCTLQGMLFAAKNDIAFDPITCSHLVDQDLEGALKALEGEDTIDPDKVAIVKFTPSAENPHAQYADEVYYPPIPDERAAARDIILPPNAVDVFDMPDPYAGYEIKKREWIPQMRRRSVSPTYFNEYYNSPLGFRLGEETRDSQDYLSDGNENEFLTNDIPYTSTTDLSVDDFKEFYPTINFLSKFNLNSDDVRKLLQPENVPILQAILEGFDKEESNYDTDVLALLRQRMENDEPVEPERFSMLYNTPEGFRSGWESRDIQGLGDDLPESRVYYEENEDNGVERQDDGSGESTEPEIFRELKQLHDKYGNDVDVTQFTNNHQPSSGLATKTSDNNNNNNGQSGIYTEGGVVYVPDSQIQGNTRVDEEESFNNDLDELLERYNSGFKRPERLDVKKPGPLFDLQLNDGKNQLGCLFSQRLCLEEIEWCFDDYAFGRCLPTTGSVEEEDLYRYDLEREVLHALSRELRRLFALGYRWSHAYTQCTLQGMLFAAKNDIAFDPITCSHLVDQDLEGALKALEGEDTIDPDKVAIVKFTPSAENPHAQYADEVYYPPIPD